MAFGITSEGLSIQTVQEIRDELNAAAVAPGGIDPNLDTSDNTPIGRLLGFWAIRERYFQEAFRDLLVQMSPAASGRQLANIAALTGTIKRPATYSTVTATVTLAAGASIDTTARAAVLGAPDAVFQATASATNSGGSPADFSVPFQAITQGPVRALSGTLTVIVTPSAGWTAVTNAADATLGALEESDPALRLRRAQELRAQGASNLDSIVAAVEALPNVLQVLGIENDSSSTDVDGRPPHTFEIVLWDGVSHESNLTNVAQAIFDHKPAGIRPVSAIGVDTSADAVDREDGTHPIHWTVASEVDVYFQLHIVADSLLYPVDGDTQIMALIASSFNASQVIGGDGEVFRVAAGVYGIAGVKHISLLQISLDGSTWAETVAGVAGGIFLADTSRIAFV